MKKLLISLVKFTFFVFLFYIIGIAIFPSWLKKNVYYPVGTSVGHLYTRLNDMRSYHNVDVLFLGSSHAYRGFDTRIFKKAGISSFNLGSSAQTPIETKVLAIKYLDQLHPSTVIYEVSPALFANDGVESSLDLIANDKISVETVKMVFDINNLKTYNTLIYGIYRCIFKLDADVKDPIKKGIDTYIPGGFIEMEMRYSHHTTFKKEKWDLKEKQWNRFNETLSLIKKHGIKIILVQAPIAPNFYNAHTNNREFDSLMNATHLSYYNFNNLQLDDSLYFSDEMHLNQNGVKIFNDTLIKVIFNRDTIR